jgi:hypothetical protein
VHREFRRPQPVEDSSRKVGPRGDAVPVNGRHRGMVFVAHAVLDIASSD